MIFEERMESFADWYSAKSRHKGNLFFYSFCYDDDYVDCFQSKIKMKINDDNDEYKEIYAFVKYFQFI